MTRSDVSMAPPVSTFGPFGPDPSPISLPPASRFCSVGVYFSESFWYPFGSLLDSPLITFAPFLLLSSDFSSSLLLSFSEDSFGSWVLLEELLDGKFTFGFWLLLSTLSTFSTFSTSIREARHPRSTATFSSLTVPSCVLAVFSISTSVEIGRVVSGEMSFPSSPITLTSFPLASFTLAPFDTR